ncbi:2,3-diaminopropionate biosynthesis protein SbnB [Streptomyces sp. NPDC051218]|uniref:2,3-diaminopropionate biosynthesis protein SbnB n=1 Tax=Streptomyces sp. NPDC051218 TaxID=3365645 RepID=UPI00379BA770
MMVISHREVSRLVQGQEAAVIEAVADGYRAHALGRTTVPHSVFLRFPNDERNRIIALPAYLDGRRDVAGVKWISSFPGNVEIGRPRASAVVVLNSLEDGRPECLLEGSIISSSRTAASAALAARELTPENCSSVSLIGCGPIAYEIVRYLQIVRPGIKSVVLHDLDERRAGLLAERCAAEWSGLDLTVVRTLPVALAAADLVVFATTAARPYTGLADCRPGTTVLHVSLRDVAVDAIVRNVNVVDDADHVCRANTSLHLAEERTGGRGFIAASIGDLLRGGKPPEPGSKLTIFSPFGLGILDLAVADLVRRRAEEQDLGTTVPDFCPS